MNRINASATTFAFGSSLLGVLALGAMVLVQPSRAESPQPPAAASVSQPAKHGAPVASVQLPTPTQAEAKGTGETRRPVRVVYDGLITR